MSEKKILNNDIVSVSTGNLGINTTSPVAKLHIQGTNSTNGGIRLHNASGNPYSIWSDNNNFYISQGNGSTTALAVTYEGNVGIGVDIPTRKLQVDAAAGYPLSLNSTQQYLMEFARGGVSEWWFAVNNGDFKFHENGVGDQVIIKAGGNVGIGTTSPQAKLHISGGSATMEWGTGVGYGIKYYSGGTYEAGFRLGTGSRSLDIYSIYDDNADGINFYTGTGASNDIKVKFANNGNVGVGTTSPSTVLDVVGEGTAIGSTGYYYNARFKDTANVGVLIGHNNTSNGNGMIAGVNKLAFLTYGTDWGERMVIDGDGNVGIGTTSPAYKLHVEDGDIGVGDQYAFKARYSTNENYHSSLRWAGLQLGNNGANRIIAGRTGVGGYLEFWVNNTNDASVYSTTPDGNFAMKIDSSGKVGIGTASPAEILHIGSGTVPAATLDGVLLTLGTGQYYQASDGTKSVFMGVDSSSYGIVGMLTDHPLGFRTNNTERMRILTNGNVGIGTTSPGAKLTVSGSATGLFTNLLLSNTNDTDGDATGIGFSMLNDMTYVKGGIFYERTDSGGRGSIHIATTNTTDSTSVGLSDARLTVDKSGNVGIGTTSPAAHLDVRGSGNGSVNDHIRITSTDTEAKLAFVNTSGNSAISSAGDDLRFFTNTANVERMRIAGSGNVGIGTASPAYKLDVDGAIKATDGFLSSTGTYTAGGTYTNQWQKVATFPYSAFSYSGFKLQVNIIGDTSNLNTNADVHINWKFQNNNGRIYANIINYGETPLDAANFEILRDGTSSVVTIYHKITKNYSEPNYTIIGTAAPTWYHSVVGASLTGETDDAFTGKDIVNSLTSRMKSGNIGIGTTSPSYKLDVAGNLRINEGDAFTDFDIKSDRSSGNIGGVNFVNASDDIKGQIYGHTDGTVKIASGGTSVAMTLLSSGNVGIGTTSPGAKLDVTGPTSTTEPTLNITSGTSQVYGNIAMYDAYHGLIMRGIPAAANTYGVNAGDQMSFYEYGGQFRFYKKQPSVLTEIARIDSSNSFFNSDVGIGTTSPTVLTSGVSSLSLGGTNISTSGGLFYQVNGTYKAYSFVSNNAYVHRGQDDVYQSFWTDASERMRIDTSGNVGIGTTSPDLKLHLAHSDGNNGLLLEHTSQASGFQVLQNIRETEGLIWQRWSSGAFSSNLMTLTYSGELGIGTTSPDQKLQIHESSSTGTYLHVTNSTTGEDGGNGSLFGISSNEETLVWNYENTATRFSTNGTEKMRIQPNGNVGIGTDNPLTKLHVEGGVTINTGTGSSTFNDLNIGGISGWANSEAHRINFVYGNGTSNIFQTIESYYGGANEGKMRFRNFYTDSQQTGILMTIHSNGNVGIGTDSPGTKLDVNGDIALKGASVFNLNAPALTIGDIAGTDSVTTLKLTTADDSTTVYLDDDGNVGIGTTSPDYKLDVEGSANNADIGIRINNTFDDNDTASNPTSVLFLNAASNNGYLRVHGAPANTAAKHQIDLGSSAGSSFLTFSPNGGERMRITAAGNVGIGTTSPASKLHVQSGAGIFNVSNDWHQSTYRTHLFRGGGFNSSISEESTAVKIFNGSAVDGKSVGNYWGGIAFMHLDPEYGSWGTSYPGEHFWIGGRLIDTPGQERSALVFATNNVTTSGSHSSEKMVILPNGNVGIGTTSPSQKLDVNGDIAVKGTSVFNLNSAALTIGDIAGTDSVTNLTLTTAGGSTEVFLDDSGNVGINDTTPSYALDVTGTIRATGDVIAYSDARVKENVETIPNALDKVKSMRGVGYNKIGEEKRSIGVIAQEMLDVIPEVVHTDDQGMHSVAYGNLVGVLIEAMKDQQKQIDELKALIASK